MAALSPDVSRPKKSLLFEGAVTRSQLDGLPVWSTCHSQSQPHMNSYLFSNPAVWHTLSGTWSSPKSCPFIPIQYQRFRDPTFWGASSRDSFGDQDRNEWSWCGILISQGLELHVIFSKMERIKFKEGQSSSPGLEVKENHELKITRLSALVSPGHVSGPHCPGITLPLTKETWQA